MLLLLGGLRGWLFPVSHGLATWGLLAVLLVAVVGTLFVIPTAAETPIIQGLLAAGVGLGAAGALLITLPAISLPSIAMVARSFPVRVIVGMGGGVAAMGLVSALLFSPDPIALDPSSRSLLLHDAHRARRTRLRIGRASSNIAAQRPNLCDALRCTDDMGVSVREDHCLAVHGHSGGVRLITVANGPSHGG
ncbi:MAG: hypothetical protein ACR2GX_03170 [Candidatus Dormibacteria bacterium]